MSTQVYVSALDETVMTYEQAVAVINEETLVVHEPSCFETGACDVGNVVRQAYRHIEAEARRRKRLVDEAAEVVAGHLEGYDRGQIVPAG